MILKFRDLDWDQRVREAGLLWRPSGGAIRGGGVFRAGREHRWGDTDSFSYRQSGQIGQALDDGDNSDNHSTTT